MTRKRAPKRIPDEECDEGVPSERDEVKTDVRAYFPEENRRAETYS